MLRREPDAVSQEDLQYSEELKPLAKALGGAISEAEPLLLGSRHPPTFVQVR